MAEQSHRRQKRITFWYHDAFATVATPLRKAGEKNMTCNIAHPRELRRRKGGHTEHLRASFYTRTSAFAPPKNSLDVVALLPPSPAYRTRTEVIETKTIAPEILREHDYWRLNSPCADVYLIERVFTEF